jgi:hypothetical protein
MSHWQQSLNWFWHDETAAVNVDFVAITALSSGLGLMVVSLISAGIEAVSDTIDTQLDGVEIRTSFGPGFGADHKFGLTDPEDTSGLNGGLGSAGGGGASVTDPDPTNPTDDDDDNSGAGWFGGSGDDDDDDDDNGSGWFGGSGGDDDDDEDTVAVGNPGNDKDVGKAGENPNGQGGWGSGSNGKSN